MEDFYNRPYVNAIAQMEMRKDVQYVGKQLLWSMTTDSAEETESHIAEVTSYATRVRANLELLESLLIMLRLAHMLRRAGLAQ